MSGFITGLLGAVAETIEPAEVRAERMESRDNYELIKVVGVALMAIAAVGALFSLINGMFFTSLSFIAIGVIAVDVATIGSNGVALSENYASGLNRMYSVASRRGITWTSEELVYEALFQDTLVLGACLRPSY